ncbi:MAG: acylphosphatase [Proteobacteria bacterium]|nr:MAG: acylphosphatase [Pseudomonadota bacterium]
MEREPTAVLVRRRIVVHGRVQGVWFRDSTERQARALGVAGWVRNRRDGTVEAVFEGDARAVERAVAYCRQGPPRARVERVDVRDEPPEGIAGFEIRY